LFASLEGREEKGMVLEREKNGRKRGICGVYFSS